MQSGYMRAYAILPFSTHYQSSRSLFNIHLLVAEFQEPQIFPDVSLVGQLLQSTAKHITMN